MPHFFKSLKSPDVARRIVPRRFFHALLWAAIALILLIGGVGVWIFSSSAPLPVIARSQLFSEGESAPLGPALSLTDELPERLDGAFAAKPAWSVKKGSRILIVPHHVVAAREIAGLFSAVSDPPSTVYLLVPDHFQRGRRAITILGSDFTVNGFRVSRDRRASEDLLANLESVASVDDRILQEEIAVNALVPYIARAFPSSKIVALTYRICDKSRAQSCADAREPLASALASAMERDPRALLVASVDFSHYLPAFAADFHDELAEDVLVHLADLETDRVELDSPDILAVSLRIARRMGLGNVTMHAHTNSLRILQAKIAQDSTSHFFASFSPGRISSQEKTTLLFVGDMMFDREVRNRMARSSESLYPFDGIVGGEERFMRGQDIVIGNLEGPISSEHLPPVKENDFAFDPAVAELLKRVGFTAVSQANNHALDQGREAASSSRVILASSDIIAIGDHVRDTAEDSLRVFDVRGRKAAILAFNVTDNPLDRDQAKEAIGGAKKVSDAVVVFMHWGNEYQATPSSAQSELAHWLIDQGADAVIGAHPHWMQSVESYRGRPIAYSLGNFIFDQDWSVETRYGLAIGLVLESESSALHLFPIGIRKSRPVLLTGDERQERLDRLAEISDRALAEAIRSGVVHMKEE